MRLSSVGTVQDPGQKQLHKAKMMDAKGVMYAGKHERLQEPQAECEKTAVIQQQKRQTPK